MKLVIIQGGAATGKSTLAKKLVKDLGFASFLKDSFKEKHYDSLNKKPNLLMWFHLEKSSWEKMYEAIEESISQDRSLLIEGNFLPRQKRRITKLLKDNCVVVEVYCYTKGWISLRRYIERNEQGKRHAGHRDRLWYPLVVLEVLLAMFGVRFYRPLGLSNNLVKINTTDTAKIGYDKVLKFTRAAR